MLSVAEAQQKVLGGVAVLPAEDCPIHQSHGRVLRQPLAADRALPPFDRVTLDGYALRSGDWTAGARRFQVLGIQAAGTIPRVLSAGPTCVEVMTGAVLPTGADAVVPYEAVRRTGDTIELEPSGPVAAGQAVHQRGSDHAAGDVLVAPGVRLSGREIAVAAACGYAHLAVSLLPKIALVTTGDELVDVSSPVAPHQIRRSNDFALRAVLLAAGYSRVECFHLRDMRHEIEHLLWHVIAEYDVVVITGGVSKGKFDFLPKVLDELGVAKRFQGVAQRPGKPFWFGLSPRQTPVFALPGNPASAFICLHRYVLPALARMSGGPPLGASRARLSAAWACQPQLTEFIPVTLTTGASGELLAQPAPLNTSGDFAGLVGTGGFVELPAGAGAMTAGSGVDLWRWV